MAEVTEKKGKITDYLSIFWKWKKLFIINMAIVSIVAVVIALTATKTFRATATIILPPESDMGFGSLTSLLSKNSTLSLGAKLFGDGGTNEDVLTGLMYSRSALLKTIDKFNLMEYYEIEDNNTDEALEAVKRNVIIEPNEFGFIEISVVNKSPEVAAEIANYFVELGDELNRRVNVETARNNRIFVEKRFLQNKEDLKNAEEAFAAFQSKYGVIALPEQLAAAVQATSRLEAEVLQKEVLAKTLKDQFSANSSFYVAVKRQIDALKSKIKEMSNQPLKVDQANILIPFKNAPELQIEYFRKYRELKMQETIMEFIFPMYEQAVVEENKSVPTVLTIDEAAAPIKRYRPKRAFIVLSWFFPFLFLHMVFAFRSWQILVVGPTNEFEEIEHKFYSKVKKIYKIKF